MPEIAGGEFPVIFMAIFFLQTRQNFNFFKRKLYYTMLQLVFITAQQGAVIIGLDDCMYNKDSDVRLGVS
jgi:hypothetical protein